VNLSASRDPGALANALAGASQVSDDRFTELIESFPFAAYRTDREGTVTHFNSACVTFAGRNPVAHEDRWCVTWKLYTDQGDFLPHEHCPMAVALKEERPVRGCRAVAERPDGSRVSFLPFPTPQRDAAGYVTGAVNLLVDLSNPAYRAFCAEQAAKCRRLAAAVDRGDVAASLLALAVEYESSLL
jgi:PAS domain-containing protein